MDLVKIISELRREQTAIDEAIVYLGVLANTQGKRRGRPPAYISNHLAVARKRKPFSAATKKKMAAAQKKRWAAFRKSKSAE